MRARGLFPLLAPAEYDPITMLIFSYVGIKKRSLQTLARLNSKGYQLTCKEELLEGFVLWQ
jgi:hypothetical protein